MGTAEAQTRLPRPRTDQYFNSGGTKHLAEQLLLKSFTHSMGTPPHTYDVYAWANSRAIKVTAEATVVWDFAYVSYFSFLFLFYFNLNFFSSCHASSFFSPPLGTHTALPSRSPWFLHLGVPRVLGRQKKRLSQGKQKNKKKWRSHTLLLQLLCILNLKCGDTLLILSSWCEVSTPVTVRPSRTAVHLQCFAEDAGSLSVRHFREGP